MGFVAILLLAVVAMAALVALGVPRLLWSLAGAALMLGATGYAVQGRPMLVASPAMAPPRTTDDDPGLFMMREAMFGRFTADGQWLVAADALTRAGARDSAVRAILGGIRATPNSALLWTGLGGALAAHDAPEGGALTPPARFAFARAMRLAPTHPGPSFFYGMAQVRAGDFPAARLLWRRALRLSPPGAPYRAEIAERLALLDRVTAMEQR